MIVGVIEQGPENATVVIRALGPTLGQPPINLPEALSEPILELHNANGTLITSNDNWQDTQGTQITASGLAPTDPLESVILTRLPAGGYTAIVRSADDTPGIALAEIYNAK